MKKSQRRYLIPSLKDEEIRKSDLCQGFQELINDNGFCEIQTDSGTVRVYRPELLVIFTSDDIAGEDMETGEELKVNGKKFLKPFIDGYLEGVDFFNKNFELHPNVLFGSNSESYVRALHYNYFHHPHVRLNKGWQFVKYSTPYILSENEMREHGFYSGIVTRVHEVTLKYPELFKSFNKCDHELPHGSNAQTILQKIWLVEPKLSVKDFLSQGIECGIWDEDYQLIVGKGSLYGSGKTLIANLSIALRGHSIGHDTDYKKVGQAFCKAFRIQIDKDTREPYKLFQFSKGNLKQREEIKRAFHIH